MPTGHLFVVLSDLLKIQCTDRIVSGEPASASNLSRGPVPGHKHWAPKLKDPVDDRGPIQPHFRLWSRGSAGPWGVQPTPATWVLDVTAAPAEEIIQRLRQALVAIHADYLRRPNEENGKPKDPLKICIPFLGTGRGGTWSQRHHLLKRLLEVLEEKEVQGEAAIVLVFSPRSPLGTSAYAAAQALRRHGNALRLERDTNPVLKRLNKAASERRLAVFLGAGVSRSAGLPNWRGFLQLLHRECAHHLNTRLPAWDELKDLDPLLCAQVLLEFAPGRNRGERATFIHDAAARLLDSDRFSLLHALLALLPVRDYVTLNFDTLLEAAALTARRPLLAIPARTLNDMARSSDQPRLLKVHGSVGGRRERAGGKIVLTTSDYIQFEQSSRAISGAVQGLMLSHHLLFVGFGMTDPNFLRIHDSVANLLPEQDSNFPPGEQGTPIATALMVEDRPWKVTFADRYLTGIHCTRPVRDESNPPDHDLVEDARRLEILMDQLVTLSMDSAAYASDGELLKIMFPGDEDLARKIGKLPPLPEGRESMSPLQLATWELVQKAGLVNRSGESSRSPPRRGSRPPSNLPNASSD